MRKVLLLALAVFSVFGAWSQRTCGTVQHEQMLMQADPHYAARRQAIDQFAQNYQYNPNNAQRTVITIPVVVHVIYSNAAGNISQAQIQSEIDRLNLDYHKSNSDTANVPAVWKSLVADCNIQFCLAQRDPNGAATTGVVRKSTTVTSWSTNDAIKYSAQGGDDAWPASSYLNIWVGNLGGGLLGYAQFPGGAAATDGVVILNTGFGSNGTAAAPYNLGRTATHEIGHWLNLIHIWGDDNGACTGTDQVADTPNQGNSNYGCPTFPLTDNCTTTSPGTMFMNYMDYVDDACMYMFTNGQNTRIQANFANGGARASILNSQGCVPVSGGPVTAFIANKTTICIGQSINFTDQTTGSPTSWSWSFPGAATTTSTTQNPQNIVYNTAGVYNVTLTATNTGGSTPLTKTNYITVLGTTPLPLREGFEGTTFPPAGWSIVNGDASTTWVRTTSASGFGTSTASAYIDNYDYNARTQKDYLYTPVYNFSHGLNASSKLKFDYAYALDQNNDHDTLQVLISTNCGTTWTSLWKKGGTQLETTTTTYNSVFVPTATQWVRDSTISLASYVGQSSVQFAFVNINDYGNSVLLDNINIDTVVNSTTCTVKPTAAFVASPTTVTVGSAITYTDQSTNSPTSWAWTFLGGTPATSTSQAPGAITYSTVGTYTTKLKVTNACGTDSTTVTVTVIPAATTSSCDTLSHLVVGDSARLYLAGATPVWGYLSGSNSYGDLAKAEKYTNTNGKPITSIIFGFVHAHSAGATDSLTINIWDANGANGLPGTVLGTTKVSMNTISTNVNGGTFHYTVATFPCPIQTNSTFYAGFNINYIAGDTIAVATTSIYNAANHPYQSYELNAVSAGVTQWAAVDSDWSYGLSDYIFPIQCTQTAPVAAFTANKTSLCPGDSVAFTDQSTNCPNSWSWQVSGPATLVSSLQNPKITFTTPGTYTVTLTASNAGGNNAHTQTSYIVVHPNPTDSLVSTPVSCFGGNDGTATVYATGGTTYTYAWSGGGTGQTIGVKPAGTYVVTVTSNYTCSSTASVSITQPFNALSATPSFTSAYCGNSNGSVSVSASGGNGGYTYLWNPGSQTTATVGNLAAGTYTVTVKDSKNCSVVTSTTVTNQSANVIISFSNSSATCGSSNGSIVATINGSSNGAHYHWSRGDTTGSITNVAAGIYTVTITNSLGCSASKADTVISSAGPSVTASATAVSCFGGNDGTATANATGGTGTLSYSWSGGGTTPTISGKPASTYTVTVTDINQCSATATTTITQPSSAVSLTTSSTPVICTTGGTASVSASGGNGGFIYVWSNTTQTTATIFNLTVGTYSVTVKDSKQCSAVTSVAVVDQSPTLSVTITKTDATCGSSTGSATANTTAVGVSYLWAPGGSTATSLSGIPAGTYTVTITNSNGCSASASTIVQNSNGANITTSSLPVTCFGGSDGSASVSATGGSGTYTYAWSGGGSGSAISSKPAGAYTVTVSDGSSCSATASVTIGGPSAALTVSATSTPVICTTQGTATVSATGGNTGAYSYSWSNTQTTATISNLSATTYTVTVKDSKQCSAVTSVTVTNQSPTISVNITKTDATCGNNNGGAVANTIANGVSYAWQPGGYTASSISALGAGTYSVTITDANGCTATAATVIQNTSGPSLSTSSTDVTCHGGNDGTASVSASGGSGSYAYTWTGGASSSVATGLTPGTYTVTVTSGSCATTATAVVGQPTAVSVTTTSSPVICTTLGSASAQGSGGSGTGYAYLWNNNQTSTTITGLPAAIYTVTVHDSKGCSATASASITTQSSTLTDSTSSVSASSATASDGSATVYPVAGTTGYSYTWSNGQHTQTISQVLPGTYTCTITDGSGCTTVATVVVGQGPNAIVDISTSVHYTLMPNPATDQCTVTIEMAESLPVELSIYSLIGQKVWSKDLGHIKSAAEVIDTHSLAGGVYIVKLKAGSQTYTTRLIRE